MIELKPDIVLRVLRVGHHIERQHARERRNQPKKEKPYRVKHVALGSKVTEDRDIKRVD